MLINIFILYEIKTLLNVLCVENILPLAYGIIDSENDASWTWFFEQFREVHGVKYNMCVVSDRNESIIKAVSRVFDGVPHYACIWHLWKNVKTLFKKSHNSLSKVFYGMAKAYKQSEFDELMEKVEQVDVRVKNYLESADYEKWARVYATINRGMVMTSNIAECINACLLEARELTVYDFLEEVRQMFARWNLKNHTSASHTFTTLCGRPQEMLVANEEASLRMKVRCYDLYVHRNYMT